MNHNKKWYKNNKKEILEKRKENYKILKSKIPKTVLITGFKLSLYKDFLIVLRKKGISRMVANRTILEEGWKKFIKANKKK